jgi:SAM-dependent methyltransferase
MEFDLNRLRAIIERNHAFYDSKMKYQTDNRLHPGTGDFILSQLNRNMRVLDIGCGNGNTLIRGNRQFAHGLGIDNDAEHIRMAEKTIRETGTTNVEFRLLDFEEDSDSIDSESFDFVFSQRGPLDETTSTIHAAIRILKPDGLILNEQIGKRHLHEVSQVFIRAEDPTELTLNQVRAEMETHGVEIRVVADFFSKRIYPDIYEWFRFQTNIWSWSGESLPTPGDPRIQLFAEQTANPSGEIAVTHHVAWIGGAKRG